MLLSQKSLPLAAWTTTPHYPLLSSCFRILPVHGHDLVSRDWLFIGRYNTHLYSPQIGSPQETKVWIPPKSDLVNQWALIGLLTGIWMEACLWEQKWHKASWEPGTHCIAYRQLNRVSFPRCLLLPGSWSRSRLFYAARLVWEWLSAVFIVYSGEGVVVWIKTAPQSSSVWMLAH